ncbi:type VII secretion target [Geodermatophilus sp. SYSU D01180]
MSDKFTVDPVVLQGLARGLTDLAEKLSEVRTVTQGVRTHDFGSPRLADAAHSFVENWQWQADQLRARLESTGKRLTEAAGNYQQVEDAQRQAQGQAAGGC